MKTLRNVIDEAFDQNTQKQYIGLLAKYEKLAADMGLQNDVKTFQSLTQDVNTASKPAVPQQAAPATGTSAPAPATPSASIETEE